MHRGRTLDNKVVYGYPCISTRSKIEGIEIVMNVVLVLITRMDLNTFNSVEIQPNSLSKPTGLFDKNGVEVFEHDVCVCVGDWDSAKKCIVTWDKKKAGFYLISVTDVEGTNMIGMDTPFKVVV